MQHYQTSKEGEGGVHGETEARVEENEEEGITAPQALADLDVLQEQDIGHTTSVSQPDLV